MRLAFAASQVGLDLRQWHFSWVLFLFTGVGNGNSGGAFAIAVLWKTCLRTWHTADIHADAVIE
jgi:hypothetical protein